MQSIESKEKILKSSNRDFSDENIFADEETFKKCLQAFDISESLGFLAYYDVNEIILNEDFQEYEEIIKNLSAINKDYSLVSEINKIKFNDNFLRPNYFKSMLTSRITKIFSIFSILVNSFTFTSLKLNSSLKRLVIPKQIAIPLLESAKILELKPIVCLWTNLHAVTKNIKELKSYKNIDEYNENDMKLENIKLAFSQTGTVTEDFFLKINYLVSIKMNKLFSIIFNINHIYYKKSYDNKELNFDEKTSIKNCLLDIVDILKFTNSNCLALFKFMDPNVFYNHVRNYFKGYSIFEEGVIFEGYNEVMKYSGASAGQDPYLTLLKSILGYEYPSNLKNYEDNLKNSFRKPHLEFINLISKKSKLVEICQKYEELRVVLKKCNEMLSAFYNIHNVFIKEFIISLASQEKVPIDKIYGVGDTPIVQVLELKNYVPKF